MSGLENPFPGERGLREKQWDRGILARVGRASPVEHGHLHHGSSLFHAAGHGRSPWSDEVVDIFAAKLGLVIGVAKARGGQISVMTAARGFVVDRHGHRLHFGFVQLGHVQSPAGNGTVFAVADKFEFLVGIFRQTNGSDFAGREVDRRSQLDQGDVLG